MSYCDDEDTRKRQIRNQELVSRMRRGESLNAFDSHQSWFPERPVIKKDLSALTELAKKNPGVENTTCESPRSNEAKMKVLQLAKPKET